MRGRPHRRASRRLRKEHPRKADPHLPVVEAAFAVTREAAASVATAEEAANAVVAVTAARIAS